ncbi:YiiD C-terminal domain-containing protein [Rhodococcus sp. ACT016]|uniref:YiiD C-terminal domain-containing protein n=1 Tax=Rhodococcus sp. ACT016 TaxID=3134808 RepID=UPI003D2866C1
MSTIKRSGSTVAQSDPVQYINSFIEHSIPPMHGLGIRIVELDTGHAVGVVPLEGNGNHMGTMYAGTLFGVAEVLGGALVIASFDMTRYYPTVKEVQIAFRRPATTDVRAEATLDSATLSRLQLDLERSGKAEFELDATLTDTAGTVVATTHGIYQIRRHATRSAG